MKSPESQNYESEDGDLRCSSADEQKPVLKRHDSDGLLTANLKYRITSQQTRMSIERNRASTIGSGPTELVRVWQPPTLHSLPSNEGSCDYASTSSEVLSSGFSLQDNLRPLVFHGMILRSTLTALIKYRIAYEAGDKGPPQPEIENKSLQEDYPRFPDIHDINIDDIDLQLVLDATPYMNTSPYVVYPNTPLAQVFNLFRTMGLRHLPVINSGGEIVGVITRHDLVHDYIEEVTHKQNMNGDHTGSERS